jgi:hypothetical protein
MAVLKDLTYIFTGITAHAIKLAVMLELMSVSTFKTDVILYIFHPNVSNCSRTKKTGFLRFLISNSLEK